MPPIPISPPPNGGIFVWNDVSPEDDNYGTIIVPKFPKPTGKGRWKRLYTSRLNVKWFNAKGDGVTDDLAALELVQGRQRHKRGDLEIPSGNLLAVLGYCRVLQESYGYRRSYYKPRTPKNLQN